METEILNYLISPPSSVWFLIIKILFILFSAFLLGFIIFALAGGTLWLKRLIIWDWQEFFTFRPFGAKKETKQWLKIKERLDTGFESDYKLAVIEADNMLDENLIKMGYTGETLMEKLEKLTTVSLPNIEEVKEVHKIRNNIVHDPDYRLTLEEAKRTIEIFEKALTDLQIL